MPVPSSITDLSRIPSDNSPQGTEAARGTIDDYFRAHAAFIRQVSDLVGGPTVVLPSAAMVNIGFASSSNVLITGTTAITSFDTVPDGVVRWVTFSGALALVHSNALQLPGLTNISTAAGDAAMFKSLGGGNWKCLSFMPVLIRYPASGLLLSDATPVSIAQGGTASINVAGARANLGLGNVDNTSDANKPVSTAQAAAIAGKVSKAGDVMSGSLDFNNNVGLYSRDAGNVLRQLLLLANDNNVYFTNGGGGSINYMSRAGGRAQEEGLAARAA
jgi:hypothetical protein